MSVIAKIASLSRRDRISSVGYALSGVWLFLVALFWMLAPGGEGGGGGIARLMAVVGVALPLALIWLAVSLARSIAVLRAEAEDLRATLARMGGDIPEAPAPAPKPLHGGIAPAPDAPRPQSRPRLPEPPRPDAQPSMALDAPPSQSVDAATLIRALNFPDGPDDHEAIDALRQALRDTTNSRVLRSAQDVVTLLAGRDIYMDDLPPDAAQADAWRRFAAGERGSAVASLGAVHDDQALEAVSAMLHDDDVFRDTAHHFLRNFDGLLARLVPELDDLQIAVMADSRSGRAFMLLGRVAGAFG